MFSVDVTPSNNSIASIQLGTTDAELPTMQARRDYINNLKNIAVEYKLPRLSPQIDTNKFTGVSAGILVDIETSERLSPDALGKDIDYLMWWEIFSQTCRTKMSVRSLHLAAGSDINAMEHTMNKLNADWDWLATGNSNKSNKELKDRIDNQKWLSFIDNTKTISPANMRAWKNSIDIHLLSKIDIAVISEQKETTRAVGFALSVLKPDGQCIVMLPNTYETSMVGLIHVFSHCFKNTTLYHTHAMDRCFLYGKGFLAGAKSIKSLRAITDIIYPHQACITFEHLNSDLFNETIKQITEFNSKLYTTNIGYYKRLGGTYQHLLTSASVKLFPNYAQDYIKTHHDNNQIAWLRLTNL
jgi:hypothetical protein